MDITKLKIVCDALPVGSITLAYLYPGETTWRDPYGGDFTPDEQHQLTSVAEYGFNTVVMHAGTEHQRTLTVRVIVDFKRPSDFVA